MAEDHQGSGHESRLIPRPPVKLFDLHSHWGTKRGYPLRSSEQLAQQKVTWNSAASYVTEDEMADYFRGHGARVILDFGFTKNLSLEEARPFHDYALATQKAHADAIFGNWIQLDPRTGASGAKELDRCIHSSTGFVSACVSAAGMGYPASDPIYDPFYEVCLAHRRPVLVLVGYTGAGAGLPGGGGIEIDLCHPRFVDKLAVRYPDLQIIAGRPAWPWQDEMIAVMLHKPNVVCELHGWSPKYFTDSLKHEIPRRLRDRVMFGADYPLFTYERLVADWRALGYGEEILEKVFHANAEKLFAGFLEGT
jgi:predicted TIM-barrel fold metal-dependent hydrolase